MSACIQTDRLFLWLQARYLYVASGTRHNTAADHAAIDELIAQLAQPPDIFHCDFMGRQFLARLGASSVEMRDW